MSRSYRTQKEAVIAERRISRDSRGAIKYPRVVERRPAPGDVHALSKYTLQRMLRHIPIEYLYGLRRIELRARKGAIGDPFGVYHPIGNFIILYSLPLVWRVSFLKAEDRELARRGRVSISKDGENWVIEWKRDVYLGKWFFEKILAHELGHHFDFRYRSKNGLAGGQRCQEFDADLRALRVGEAFFRGIRVKKAAKVPANYPPVRTAAGSRLRTGAAAAQRER